MKTIEEILNSKAIDNGYKHIFHALDGSDIRTFKMIENAMKEYAKQVAEAQREAVTERYCNEDESIPMYDHLINTPLVTDNI